MSAEIFLKGPEPRYVDPANACDDRSTIEAKSQATDQRLFYSSKLALWITRHWPFSCYNRLMWPVQLWLIGVGSRAFCEEIYGSIE